MGSDPMSGTFNLDAVMRAIEADHVRPERRSDPADGVIQKLADYVPTSETDLVSKRLAAVDAAESGGVKGLLDHLDSEGKFAIRENQGDAYKYVGERYQEEVAANRAAGLRQYRMTVVKDGRATFEVADASEAAGRKSGAITGPSVPVCSIQGDYGLAAGMRGYTAGAWHEHDKDPTKGIAPGLRGDVPRVGAHPDDPTRNPGTYVTVKADPDSKNPKLDIPEKVLCIETPEDRANNVPRDKTMSVFYREDMPFALTEKKQERGFDGKKASGRGAFRSRALSICRKPR